MSTTETHVRQAQEALTDMVDGWYQPAKALFKSVPTTSYGLLNPTEIFAQASRLSQRLAGVNIEYVQDLAGAMRKHVTGLASVLKDEMATTAKVTIDQVEKFEEAAVDQADQAERARTRRGPTCQEGCSRRRWCAISGDDQSRVVGRTQRSGSAEER